MNGKKSGDFPSQEWIFDQRRKEIDYRRDKQEKVFQWTFTVLVSVIAAILAVKTAGENPRGLGVSYSIVASVVVVVLSIYSVLWMRHNWKLEEKVRQQMPTELQSAWTTNKKTAPPYGYDLAVGMICVAVLVAIWLPPISKEPYQNEESVSEQDGEVTPTTDLESVRGGREEPKTDSEERLQ